MQIDRPGSDSATARERDASHSHARHQRSQNQRGSTHGLDQLVRSLRAGQVAATNRGTMLGAAVTKLDLGTHRGKKLALGLDVANLRNVFQDDGLVGKQSRRHCGQGGILGTTDADGPQERVAAANDKLVHKRKSQPRTAYAEPMDHGAISILRVIWPGVAAGTAYFRDADA